VVLCCYREALRHICGAVMGASTPPSTGSEVVGEGAAEGAASTALAVLVIATASAPVAAAAAGEVTQEVGLMVEVGSAEAIATLAAAACKLMSHALRLSPQTAAGLLAGA
jgi:hypothetical protein